jgi:hypothetical protein
VKYGVKYIVRNEATTGRGIRGRSDSTSGGIYMKALVLRIVKRTAGYSVRMRKMRDWTLWSSRPPPKRKNRLHTEEEPEMYEHRLLYVVFFHRSEKQDDGDKPGLTDTL